MFTNLDRSQCFGPGGTRNCINVREPPFAMLVLWTNRSCNYTNIIYP